ncbi:uncharacterized protein LOC113282154 [Papaver somniferum]|uniref:uncharacterized protein LOC113282154 n=1 Tax=Papaver somniferum TaxID=3469 RepID=UPI000E7050B7|nr:uncharacterized protein LOC113282154 [Papaver somniferum]
MLLSIDLHKEKIRFVQLPAECTLTAANERQYLAVDHLLEFKGYPCIARSERIIISNNDHYGHRCNYQTGVCCCCCKVHMYVLKDKEKQIWIREENFDVQIKSQEGFLQYPLCWYFDASAATTPTRILAFSDQVLLYWFNGERLICYNLQEKHLKVIECSRPYPGIFQTKMNEHLNRGIGDDDNFDCPSMDYQLHAQVENILSLKTFIPKGAETRKFDCADDLLDSIRNNLPAGWLFTGRET